MNLYKNNRKNLGKINILKNNNKNRKGMFL